MKPDPPPDPATKPLPPSNPTQGPCLDSADLFADCKEVTIRHGEEIYRLRLTKSGKLILHK